MIIVSTAFFGAYIVVRGASVYIGHFPEEYTLARAIMNGQFKYVYIVTRYHGKSMCMWQSYSS